MRNRRAKMHFTRNRLVLVVASSLVLAAAGLISLTQITAPTGSARAIQLTTTGEDWPTYLHDAARSGASGESILSTANAGQLVPLWSYLTSGTVAAQAAVVSGVVYVGSWDGYEYALNGTTGALLWKTFLGQTFPGSSCSPPYAGITSSAAVQNGVVYVGGGDSNWYALNAATGSVLWKVYTGDNSATGGHYNWSSPLLYNGYAYIGVASYGDCPLVQGQLIQVNLTTQAVNTLNLVGHVGGGIWTSPSVDANTNTIYVTTGTLANSADNLPQAMVAINASTLQVESSWQVPAAQTVTDSDWGTTPLIYTDASSNNWVAGINKNGILYAFNRSNIAAGPVWEYQMSVGGECAVCGMGSVSSGTQGGGLIYFAGGNTTVNGNSVAGSVRAFNPANGSVVWQVGTSGPVIPAITYDDGLIFVGAGKQFEVLNASTGSLLYSYTAGGTFYGPPSISNGIVYAGATDDKLYAWGLSSASTGFQITNLQVNDTANAGNWSIQTSLQSGAVQFGDRGYTFTSVPAPLAGAEWIRTANSSKTYTGNPTATFNITQSGTIYVALDSRIKTPPSWIDSTWTNTGLTMTNNQAAGSNSFVLYSKTFPAGSVSLGPNGGGSGVSMYTVIGVGTSSSATPTPTATSTPTPLPTATPSATPTSTTTPAPTPTPTAGPTQLSNLVVSDTTNAKNWSLQTNLQVGAVQYGDRGYTFSTLPSGLLGAAWIRTANGSKSYTGNPTVSFTINQSATVYVAVDARMKTPPSFIDGTWTNTGLTLTDNQAAGSNSFVLYSKTFPAGSVSLGPNGGGSGVNMYSIIVP